jgi:hypothetical protein
MFLALYLQETVRARLPCSKTPQKDQTTTPAANRTDLSRERDRMFRFMWRFDAALSLLQAFEMRILQLPQVSIAAVTIIRHPQFVLEADGDSFTLCTVMLVQTPH